MPLLTDARTLASAGFVTGGSTRNWKGYGSLVDLTTHGAVEQAILTDPQTSGGLLVACAPESVNDVLECFRRDGFQRAAVIGEIEAGSPACRWCRAAAIKRAVMDVGIALTRLSPEARGGLTDDQPTRYQASGASEDGGEGGNRTHPPAQSVGATILKTVTTTRHVSLSILMLSRIITRVAIAPSKLRLLSR